MRHLLNARQAKPVQAQGKETVKNQPTCALRLQTKQTATRSGQASQHPRPKIAGAIGPRYIADLVYLRDSSKASEHPVDIQTQALKLDSVSSCMYLSTQPANSTRLQSLAKVSYSKFTDKMMRCMLKKSSRCDRTTMHTNDAKMEKATWVQLSTHDRAPLGIYSWD